MSVSMKEMNQILRELSEWERRNKELRRENEKLRKFSEALQEGYGKEAMQKIIEQNERKIWERMQNYAVLLGVIGQVLTEQEQNVILLRHIRRKQWDIVAYRVGVSKSSCIRMENRAMEKLRAAWAKEMEKSRKQEDGKDEG